MSPLRDIGSIKEMNSPAARMYNWNILVPLLAKFKIDVKPQEKSQLMTGDPEKLNHFLKLTFAYGYNIAGNNMFKSVSNEKDLPNLL